MLNSVGGMPQDLVQVVPSPILPVNECVGKQLLMGGLNLHILDQGNYSDVYKVRCGTEIQALQVRNCVYSMAFLKVFILGS